MPKFSFIFFLLRSDQIKDYADTELPNCPMEHCGLKATAFVDVRRGYKTWLCYILGKILLSNR